ncbi:MAG: hypothetical protein US30_C0002G0023 [Candidatus Moranbacteria bacterium GW2011_GWF2_36_839]|nr:MAG: hypothetical protein US27_C0003G0023 [Candidatus Moranbacteria bacterium GW2011_GWF1_36_78]KKQ17563.1 MAG: hypothetical protein US30_C0002G0023 [Candidatus Moranbacteria bacterium GW2011_GWF2_36_839]HAT74287.1 hypothetical protein [Candidatus Moranbacteria bacterium]HBY10934.1 hypothetical protein [Candidatus Moranbacteria bacterium]
MVKTEKKVAEENSGKKLIIFIFTLLFAIAIVKTVQFSYNHLTTNKGVELYYLQNKAALIENGTLVLKKITAGFNKKIDEISKTREKYPAGEPIPKKIDLCKIIAGKEVIHDH